MKYAWIIVVALVAFAVPALAADEGGAQGAAPAVAPAVAPAAAPEPAAVDWVLRSQATTKLLEFQFAIRKEGVQRLDLLTRYLKNTGRWDAYQKAEIVVHDSAARRAEALGVTERLANVEVVFPDEKLTVDRLIEMAEAYIVSMGYTPGVVTDAEEIDQYKRMAQSQKALIIKTAKSIDIGLKEVMRMFTYIESINDLEGLRAYAIGERREAQARTKEWALQQAAAKQEAFNAQNAQFRANYDRFLSDTYRYQGSGTDYYDNR